MEPPQELPTPSPLPALKLVAGVAPEARRIHHLRDGAVVLYRRSRSLVWQVRYKLEDRRWHRSSTGHRELEYALKAAGTMYDRARFKEEMGLPQRTAGFGAVAGLCLKQLDAEIEQGLRPMTNRDYQRAIRKYLIPHFGRYNLTSIDNNLVREFELWRNQQIGHMPVASTLANHAAAYNRVIDLAVERGWLSANNLVLRLSRRGVELHPNLTQDLHPILTHPI